MDDSNKQVFHGSGMFGPYSRGCGILAAALIVGAAVWPFCWDAFIRPLLFSNRAYGSVVQCEANLRAIGAGLLAYAQDWDEHLPPTESWTSAYLARNPDQTRLHCPAAPVELSYAMNSVEGGQ